MIFVHIPSVGADQQGVHQAITEVSVGASKPLIAVMPAADGTGLIPAGSGLLPVLGPDGRPEHGSVPTFSNVEDAVHALALVRGYARWRDSERAEVPAFYGTYRITAGKKSETVTLRKVDGSTTVILR